MRNDSDTDELDLRGIVEQPAHAQQRHRGVAAARIPLTVCPTSNVRIANAFERLEDHVYPQMRARGLLATLNTDDPALTDLDLAMEYRSVAAAFGWGWDEMVAIALDGVDACWLDDTAKVALGDRSPPQRPALAPDPPTPKR